MLVFAKKDISMEQGTIKVIMIILKWGQNVHTLASYVKVHIGNIINFLQVDNSVAAVLKMKILKVVYNFFKTLNTGFIKS